jgi:steroid 5-alpha reductase family enzyme
VAFISVFGVVLLLTMVYTIVWVMITRQDNKYTKIQQLWLPILAGFTITMIQTLGIDMLRFWLTGTWGGFPLGG